MILFFSVALMIAISSLSLFIFRAFPEFSRPTLSGDVKRLADSENPWSVDLSKKIVESPRRRFYFAK